MDLVNSLIDKFRFRSPLWLYPVWDSFEKYAEKGYKVAKSGTLAVCERSVVNIGEARWVHTAAAGASNELLENIEQDLGFRFYSEDVFVSGLPKLTGGYDFDHFVPDKVKELLRAANGMRLFSGHLTISGVLSVPAAIKSSVHEGLPLIEGSMTDLNIFNRPKSLKPKILLIGSYGYNGSLVYVREGTEKVFCCNKQGVELARWEGIEYWIASEMQRLSNLFDDDGIQIDFNKPTSPPTDKQ